MYVCSAPRERLLFVPVPCVRSRPFVRAVGGVATWCGHSLRPDAAQLSYEDLCTGGLRGTGGAGACRRQGEGPVKAEAIAAVQDIPHKFLEGILGDLRRGGIVDSRRGGGGGYRLAREASAHHRRRRHPGRRRAHRVGARRAAHRSGVHRLRRAAAAAVDRPARQCRAGSWRASPSPTSRGRAARAGAAAGGGTGGLGEPLSAVSASSSGSQVVLRMTT